MNPIFDLTGKKAVVTGGASGLSKGMAEGLHEFGASVVLMDIQDAGESIAAEMGKTGASVRFVKADLGDRDSLEKGFAESVKILGGGIDILINGAGIQRKIKTEDFPAEEWDKVIEINQTAPFLLCQLAGRIMLRQRRGKIINIASLMSFFGGESVIAYSAAKGAIAQMTKCLCNEWAAHGINVNAIAPGFMETELNSHIINGKNPERHARIAERIPAGRWGTPADTRYLTVFLASAASDYINGAVIPCDGGYLAK